MCWLTNSGISSWGQCPASRIISFVLFGVNFLYRFLFFGVFIHGSFPPQRSNNGAFSFANSLSNGNPWGPDGVNTLLKTLKAPKSREGFLIDSTKNSSTFF